MTCGTSGGKRALSGAALTAAIVIACGAAVFQSLTGFGFALIMVPLLSLVWDVKAAVVTSTVLGTFALVPLLFEARRHVRLTRAAALVTGSLVGVPAGIVLLDWIDPKALKILVGATVIAASVLIYRVREIRATRAGVMPAVAVGAVSGVLRASTSMGGPPAVLYLLGAERDVEVFRGTILAFFLPMSLVTIAGLAAVGRVTPEVVRTSAIALPAMAIGMFAGVRLRSRVHGELFRFLVLLLLILTSIGVIISASLGGA
jgi:uncharacterized membrane protein YfcA